MSKNTKELLNQSVADITVAITVVRQVHWYMRGSGFMKLHPLMDTYMDELSEIRDEIAERLITIGGSPATTLAEYNEMTKVKIEKASFDKDMDSRLEEIVTTYRYLIELFKKGIAAADKGDDPVTSGIFTDGVAALEKAVWMLQAERGHAPGL